MPSRPPLLRLCLKRVSPPLPQCQDVALANFGSFISAFMAAIKSSSTGEGMLEPAAAECPPPVPFNALEHCRIIMPRSASDLQSRHFLEENLYIPSFASVRTNSSLPRSEGDVLSSDDTAPSIASSKIPSPLTKIVVPSSASLHFSLMIIDILLRRVILYVPAISSPALKAVFLSPIQIEIPIPALPVLPHAFSTIENSRASLRRLLLSSLASV